MEKLTYKNENQLHNDAVKMLLESHLSWSGSDKNMPSDDLNNVRGQFLHAHIDADFTDEEWDALSEEERDKYNREINVRFETAASEADVKWTAVKIVLDL